MDDETALLIEQRIAPLGSRAGDRHVVCFFAGGPLDGQFVLLKSDPDWHTPSIVRIGEGDVLHKYSQLTDVHYYWRGCNGTPPAD